MPIVDYASLKDNIATTAWRDDADFTDRVDDFIQLAESSLSKRLRVREMRRTAVLTQTDGLFSTPDDLIAVINLRTQSNPTRALEPIGQDYIDFIAGSRPGGLPSFYSVDGDGLRLFPSNASPIMLGYIARIPALSDENPTNWLLKKSPELYRNAAMLEAALLTQEQDKLPVYGTLVEDGIASLQAMDVATSYAGAQTRLQMVTP